MATTGGVRERPTNDKDFKKPVSWLLGPQLIASLKLTALFIAFKSKLDPRDWMHAKIHPFDEKSRLNEGASADEFWFDFLADAGDGQRAMYSLAYMCLSDLWIEKPATIKSAVAFDKEKIGATSLLLPRGEFLFVGGDAGYHIADYATLTERFQAPFHWAFADLKKAMKITDDAPRRPLFGLPANHDYYDFIDGFNRQFRKPTSADNEKNLEGLTPQLSIPGFKRFQQSSYVALKLPFGWWFWGLDNEIGRLDIRQQEFFKRLGKPHKLIVATPEPTTVAGRFAKADDVPAQAFVDLGLERPFLPDEDPLPEDKIRLDLSGDMHHYARYWGPRSEVPPPADSSDAQTGKARSASNYASVVSGLGGAFLHPSHTSAQEIKEQVLYPPAQTSRQAVAARLFNPLHVILGGYVALVGASLAAIIYFAATVPRSSRVVVEHLLQRLLGVAGSPATESAPGFIASSGLTPLDVVWRLALLVLSVVFIVMSVGHSKQMVDQSQDNKTTFRRYRLRVAALIAAAVGCLVVGGWTFVERRASLSPFNWSLLILFFILWSVAALAASIVYADWLNKQARKEGGTKWDYWPVWTLVILSAGILCAGIALFGKYPVAYVFSDLIFASTIFGGVANLILLAVLVGGAQQSVVGKIGFGVLGAWHALLQLAVPYLLVRIGSVWAWAAAIAIVLVFVFIGNQVTKRKWRWALVITWIVYGGMLLYLPFALCDPSPPPLDLKALAWRLIVVIALGALMSCVWLGWYLAVSLEFNGHTNEAGGAARIEQYKEFIRFRLTRDKLTGYVIGVDEPLTHGAALKMRIVDVFHLTAKRKD